MDFPKEVIEDFLMRLPVKVLMTFKCVSKEWNDLISNGSFRKRYQFRQQSKRIAPTGFIWHTIDMLTNKFFFTSQNKCVKEVLESFDSMKEFGFVLAASKGLLLLYFDDLRCLYVYDLVSKKHVELPRNFGDHDYLGFKCEEKSINNHHRLCYKVVCIEKPSENAFFRNTSYSIETYSSETGTWKKSTVKVKLLFFMPCGTFIAKVIEGVFHWYLSYLNYVIAYDSDDPKGRAVTIQLPLKDKYIRRRDNGRELEGTKDGSLQFITINNMVVDVWILRNYLDEDIIDAKKWNLSSSINLQDIGRGIGSNFGRDSYRIIGADPTNSQIIYLNIGYSFYAYNYYEGKVLLTAFQRIESGSELFVYFEWPTWPCL